MKLERVPVPGSHRELEAYLALPDGGPARRSAVIVIHEIFGPDAHIQDVAGRFASEGYVAIAPNLFTGEIQALLTPAAVSTGMGFLRSLPPEEQRDPVRIRARIAERPAEERALLEALLRIQDPARHREFAQDLVGVARYLRSRDDVEPRKVASVGFCFGGGMSALLAAADPDLAAAVIFYGNSPSAELVPRIRCPILGLYGSEDRRITDTVPKFADDARRAGVDLAYHVYPGASHAFFNDTRPQAYQPDAARDAWRRVLEFFRKNLR